MLHIKAIINDKYYTVKFDNKNNADSFTGLINDKKFKTDIKKIKDNYFSIIYKNKIFNVDIVDFLEENKEITLKVNNHLYKVNLKTQRDDILKEMGFDKTKQTKEKELKAPMPGRVLDILVKEGDKVSKDMPLLILEAMKMENILKANSEIIIKSIFVKKGESVEKNQLLIKFN